jgi:hypothetical protein
MCQYPALTGLYPKALLCYNQREKVRSVRTYGAWVTHTSLPKIALADRFFMTPYALKLLESVGTIARAPERTKEKITNVQGATVIAAEYGSVSKPY